jgi:asparagine synthase (glutamine-hydrolysing)
MALRQEFFPNGPSWDLEDYGSIWGESQGAALLDRLTLLNLRTYLVDDLLPKVDRMAMAHALEVRSPFLDTELVELALQLPPGTKVRGLSQKRVLKRAMADVLPHEVLHRPKHGFGIPLARWFRNELRPYLESRLSPPAAKIRQHLLPGAIDRVVAEHLSGTADHCHALWTMVTLEEFLRKEDW